MAKDVYQFACPCCSKQIEIDTRTGLARAKNPGEAKGGQDLDQLLKAQQHDSKRLDKVFGEDQPPRKRERAVGQESLRAHGAPQPRSTGPSA